MTFFFSGFHADYLKANDEMDMSDYDIFCKRMQLIYYTAWQLTKWSYPACAGSEGGVVQWMVFGKDEL
ncbi:hypothetical protein OKW96_12075 [Sphingobacterium sp. KU25419]|nr:hypothetical protein OKW96_12075 [Sphingobacterium sp. KU25419]